jgi:hypothetical protein
VMYLPTLLGSCQPPEGAEGFFTSDGSQFHRISDRVRLELIHKLIPMRPTQGPPTGCDSPFGCPMRRNSAASRVKT